MEEEKGIAVTPAAGGSTVSTEEALATALRLHGEGRLEAARDLLGALLEAHPDDARLPFHCARVCEAAGREQEALPLYERALAGDLVRQERRAALIGLGSTARSLGRYQQSLAALRQGRDEFPGCRAMTVFLAMTLYNLEEHREAMGHLLHALAQTSRDPAIRRYRQVIAFYAERLEAIWT